MLLTRPNTLNNFPRCYITDSEALKLLLAERIMQYVEEHGWVRYRESDRPGKTNCYRYEKLDDCGDFKGSWYIDVPVPKCRGLKDYHLRVSEVLNQIAEVEDRSELDIYYEILHPEHKTKPVFRTLRSFSG